MARAAHSEEARLVTAPQMEMACSRARPRLRESARHLGGASGEWMEAPRQTVIRSRAWTGSRSFCDALKHSAGAALVAPAHSFIAKAGSVSTWCSGR